MGRGPGACKPSYPRPGRDGRTLVCARLQGALRFARLLPIDRHHAPVLW